MMRVMDAFPQFLSILLVLLLFSAFVKIFTSLTILGTGLGLRGTGFGVVIFGFALLLSLVTIESRIGPAASVGGMFQGDAGNAEALEQKLRPFMKEQTDAGVRERIGAFVQSAPASVPETAAATPAAEQPALDAAAFLITQLRDAFTLGCMFIIPFLVIDLVTANILGLLGVVQLSVQVVSLPVKLLLFLAIDGWTLVTGKLLGSFFGA